MTANIDTPTSQLPALPEQFELGLGLPFGGLFGSGVQARVLSEIVSDPFRAFSIADLVELTEATGPSLRASLERLAELGIVTRTLVRPRSWVYNAVPNSKRLLALTLLTLSVIDDKARSSVFDEALRQLSPASGPPVILAQVILDQRTFNYYAGGTNGNVVDVPGVSVPIEATLAQTSTPVEEGAP